jgi:hypothetical protein
MDEKDLAAIMDFLNKNPQASSADVMKAFPAVKDEKTADAVFGYAHGLEQGNSPKKLQGLFPELFAQPTAHQAAIKDATNTLNSAYASPAGDKAIDYLNKQAHDMAFYNSRQQQLQGQDATARQVLAPPMLHQTAQTMRDQYRQDNPDPTRETIAAIGHLDPTQQGDLNAATYLKDRQSDGDRQKQLANAAAIKKGDLMYNVHTGALTKPLDPLESIAYGWNQRKQSMAGYDTLTNSPDADVKTYLNNQVAKKDPDEPQPKPYNWGTLTSGIGSEAIPTSKMIIAGAAATATGNPELAPAAAALATSSEYYKRNYHDSMVRVYADAKQKGMSDDQALAYARPIAEKDAELSVVQNAAMTAAGARLGMGDEGYEAFNQPGVKKVLGTAINNMGKFGKNALKEGTAMGALSAGVQGQENINEGKNTTDNMLEAGEMGGVMPVALGLMIHAPKEIISGHGLNVVKQALTQVPTEAINSELGSMVQDGSITPDKAMDITKAIADHKAKDAAIPPSVKDPEARVQIQDKLDKRAVLQKQLETSAEPYHEAIKEKIANIDTDIQAIPAKVREQQKADEAEPKTTQNAVPKQSPDAVSVSKEPGAGQEVGSGTEGRGQIVQENAGAQNTEKTISNEQATTTSQSSTKLSDRNGEPSNAGGKEKEGPQAAEATNANATATGEPGDGRILNFRTPDEVDRIMRQDIPKESRNAQVDVASVDPKTGEETTEQAPARRVHIDLKRQYKILDKILGCL